MRINFTPLPRVSSVSSSQPSSPVTQPLHASALAPIPPLAPFADRHRRGLHERLRAFAVHTLAPGKWKKERHDFQTELKVWIGKGAPTEQRAAAAKLIEDALRFSRSTLDLSGLRLKTLPACIENLSMLETLKLNKNRLSDLPENIGQLKWLKRLELRHNRLTSLPGSVNQIAHVDVAGNRLRDMPDMDNLRLRMATGPYRTRPQPMRRMIIN